MNGGSLEHTNVKNDRSQKEKQFVKLGIVEIG